MSFSSQKQKTGGKTDMTTTSSRTFDTPEAQQALRNATSMFNQPGLDTGFGSLTALQGLNSEMQAGGGRNPYLESIISAGNQEAQGMFDTNLAKARAGGFRGGTGANLLNQGLLANEFANDRSRINANLRYNDAAQATDRRLQVANALAGAAQGYQGGNMALLNMLAGQKQTQKGKTTGSASGSSTGFDLANMLGSAALAYKAF